MTTTTQPTSTTLAVINASIALVSELVPVAGAVIAGVKAIWLTQNPGKSEADWLAALHADSATLTTEADAQLLKDGWTRDAAGKWMPPAAPGATTAA